VSGAMVVLMVKKIRKKTAAQDNDLPTDIGQDRRQAALVKSHLLKYGCH